MPGLASYGGASDYSTLFANLVSSQLNEEESNAREADTKRLNDLAAQDAEMFDKYNAGKISDTQILAYIDKRKKETAYDPTQQEQWVKAQIDYTQSINDGRAEAAYAAGGSIWALIAYYRSQMGSVAKGSPRYRDLQGKVTQLTDQGVNQDVTRGADRIVAKINAGKATLSDLLTFYKSQLQTARPGSDIRNQIQQQIADTQTKIKQQAFETNLAKISYDLQAGTITPQQAGARQSALVESNPALQTSDPARYYSLLSDATKMSQTINDQAQLAQIQAQLDAGEISPSQAQQQYYALAEQYKTIDPTTYWNLRDQGAKVGGSALTNPDALGAGFTAPMPSSTLPAIPGYVPPSSPTGVNNLPFTVNANGDVVKGNIANTQSGLFRWISQLDGTEFADINCAAASTAMLAYVMGVSGLSGGDIRALSGDTSGGISLDQDLQVLKKLGVKGLEDTSSSPVSFADFKARIAAGSPAVVSGIYGNVAANLRVSPNLWGTHQMMIAAYDAKKNAFLVYDPAVSPKTNPNYKGEWWPASQIKNFGWGPSMGGYTRYGQVLFTPTGTIKPGQETANHVRFVSVDTPPQRPETPKSYVGLNNPGPSGQAPGLHPTVTTGGNPKSNPLAPQPAGTQTRPTTDVEAKALLDQNEQRISTIGAMTDAFAAGQSSITIGGQTIALDQATVAALNQEALWRQDHDIMLTEAMGDMSGAATLRDTRAKFVNQVKAANTVPVEQLWNTLVRDVNKDLTLADLETDPTRAYADIQKAQQKLTAFQQTQQKISGSGELNGIDVPGTNQDLQGAIDATVNALNIAVNKDATAADKNTQIAQIAADAGLTSNDPGIALVAKISDTSSGIASVENGTGVQVSVDGQIVVAPVRQVAAFDANGNPTTQSVADVGSVVKGATADQLVPIAIDGATGPTTIMALPSQYQVGNYLQYTKKITAADGGASGAYLTATELQDTERIKTLLIQGKIAVVPYALPEIVMPDRIVTGPKRTIVVKGDVWVQDPDTKSWSPLNPDGTVPFIDHKGAGMPGDPSVIAYNPDTQAPDIQFTQPDTAVPAPYDGHNPQAVQRAINAGTLSVPPIGSRDANGDPTNTPASETPYLPNLDTTSELNARLHPAPQDISNVSSMPGTPDVYGPGAQALGIPNPAQFSSDGKALDSVAKAYTPPAPQDVVQGFLGDIAPQLSTLANQIGITVPPPSGAPTNTTSPLSIPPPTTYKAPTPAQSALPKITVAQPKTVTSQDIVKGQTPGSRPHTSDTSQTTTFIPPPPVPYAETPPVNAPSGTRKLV